MRLVFSGDELMEQFYFPNDDRTLFDDIDIDEEKNIVVKDKDGNDAKIVFCITRNTTRGFQHIVYGQVLNVGDDGYRQVEFRIHKNRADLDNIKMFIQGPYITAPLHFNESR